VQHGKPGDAVAEVQERARQTDEILRELILAERVDLHRVHRPAPRAQQVAQPGQMRAALHEHGNRLIRSAASLAVEYCDDFGNFCA
jgi:hypothetical protein